MAANISGEISLPGEHQFFGSLRIAKRTIASRSPRNSRAVSRASGAVALGGGGTRRPTTRASSSRVERLWKSGGALVAQHLRRAAPESSKYPSRLLSDLLSPARVKRTGVKSLLCPRCPIASRLRLSPGARRSRNQVASVPSGVRQNVALA